MNQGARIVTFKAHSAVELSGRESVFSGSNVVDVLRTAADKHFNGSVSDTCVVDEDGGIHNVVRHGYVNDTAVLSIVHLYARACAEAGSQKGSAAKRFFDRGQLLDDLIDGRKDGAYAETIQQFNSVHLANITGASHALIGGSVIYFLQTDFTRSPLIEGLHSWFVGRTHSPDLSDFVIPELTGTIPFCTVVLSPGHQERNFAEIVERNLEIGQFTPKGSEPLSILFSGLYKTVQS